MFEGHTTARETFNWQVATYFLYPLQFGLIHVHYIHYVQSVIVFQIECASAHSLKNKKHLDDCKFTVTPVHLLIPNYLVHILIACVTIVMYC